MSWGDELAAWWLEEVAGDPAYRDEVMPLSLEMMRPLPGERWLDLGCGEGRLMAEIVAAGGRPVGCDVSEALARRAVQAGPTVIGRLPDLGWCADARFDGVFAVLVVEHVADLAGLLGEAARVTKAGGTLAVVANHPAFTAVGSAPVVDATDGEVLWRWGDYLGSGSTMEPAGRSEVTFHHRSMAELLSTASAAGWNLRRLVERGASAGQVRRDPLLSGQEAIPRLLGVRWERHREP